MTYTYSENKSCFGIVFLPKGTVTEGTYSVLKIIDSKSSALLKIMPLHQGHFPVFPLLGDSGLSVYSSCLSSGKTEKVRIFE